MCDREALARAWDEGHRTPRQYGPDDCKCGAWWSGECGCGEFESNPITPNPYRTEVTGSATPARDLTPGARDDL